MLDAEATSDIDTTGAEALAQAIEALREREVTFAVARAHAEVRALLRTYDLLERIGEERLYPTNRDSVAAFRRETGRPSRRRPPDPPSPARISTATRRAAGPAARRNTATHARDGPVSSRRPARID